jgi:hypothetical protein
VKNSLGPNALCVSAHAKDYAVPAGAADDSPIQITGAVNRQLISIAGKRPVGGGTAKAVQRGRLPGAVRQVLDFVNRAAAVAAARACTSMFAGAVEISIRVHGYEACSGWTSLEGKIVEYRLFPAFEVGLQLENRTRLRRDFRSGPRVGRTEADRQAVAARNGTSQFRTAAAAVGLKLVNQSIRVRPGARSGRAIQVAFGIEHQAAERSVSLSGRRWREIVDDGFA